MLKRDKMILESLTKKYGKETLRDILYESNEIIEEGLIDDIKNKFGKRIERTIRGNNDIEYTPQNSKEIYTTSDVLMLMSKRFQNKFEQFIIEASRWGKEKVSNYRYNQFVEHPPVMYDKGKFYVKIPHTGWTLVDFNYNRLRF